MKRLLLTTALAVGPFFAANPALADCNDVSPGGGDTVTCDATSVLDGPDAIETREIDDGSSDVTVVVETGASLDTTASGADAIKLKDSDNAVENSGTIDGGDEAIVLGEDGTVDNFTGGVIKAQDQGIVGENEDDSDADGITVNNAGLIMTEDRAINVGSGAGLKVVNSGTIMAGDEGIQGGDFVEVENSGSITAKEKGIDANGTGLILTNEPTGSITSTANEGVEAGDDAIILNAGEIKAFDDAIQVGENATIVNDGLIENTQTAQDLIDDPSLEAQDAIDIDSGFISNASTGRIISTVDAAIDFDPTTDASVIDNAGVIKGTIAVNTAKAEGSDPADEGQQTINNSGLLEGTSGLALDLGLGDDTLNMMMGGTMMGRADFGAGLDSLIFDTNYVFDMDFAGGALLDGGDDFDTVFFDNLLFSDLTIKGLTGDTVEFLVFDTYELNLTSWESFSFSDDTRVAFDQLAPVPLPAGAVLLGSGIAAMAVARRRQRTKAA